MNASEAKDYIRAGEFEATSMLPKIEAALEFLEKKPDGQVIINAETGPQTSST